MIQDRPTVTIERQQKYPAISDDLFTTFNRLMVTPEIG